MSASNNKSWYQLTDDERKRQIDALSYSTPKQIKVLAMGCGMYTLQFKLGGTWFQMELVIDRDDVFGFDAFQGWSEWWRGKDGQIHYENFTDLGVIPKPKCDLCKEYNEKDEYL